jgi:FAD/FMN-containing dehydrogenase
MTQQHPITPPPELVEDWIEIAKPLPQRPPNPGELATLAARWGADQELEACCEWISKQDWTWTKAQLVAARRPKPPSLKEEAIDTLHLIRDHLPADMYEKSFLIRRALESLPD